MASKLLQNSQFSLGMQIEFFFNWTKWIQSLKANDNSENECQNYESNGLSLDRLNLHKSSSIHSQSTHSSVTTKTLTTEPQNSNMTLKDILSYGPYGPGVLSHYKEHKHLNEKTRRLLGEAFIHHCATTNATVSKSDCKSLSFQIQECFDGEIAVKN